MDCVWLPWQSRKHRRLPFGQTDDKVRNVAFLSHIEGSIKDLFNVDSRAVTKDINLCGLAWSEIDQVKGCSALAGDLTEDVRSKFVVFWVYDNYGFTGLEGLAEKHCCGDTFAKAGAAQHLHVS